MSKFRMAIGAVAIAAIGAVGVLTGVGIASTAENTATAPSAPTTSAPLPGSTATSRVQFAQVNADGTLARGSVGTGSSKSNTGVYLVTFPRKTGKCGYSATVGQTNSSGTTGPRFIEAEGAAGDDHGVFLETYDMNGDNIDTPFTVAILCKVK